MNIQESIVLRLEITWFRKTTSLYKLTATDLPFSLFYIFHIIYKTVVLVGSIRSSP